MSVKVQTWVWFQSRTIGNDRLVLLAIADDSDDDGTNAYPSIGRLALKTRLHPATVRRCIRNIESIGELSAHVSAGRHANDYVIHMDTLTLKDSRQRPAGPTRRGPGRHGHQPSQSARVQPSQSARVEPEPQPPRYRVVTPRGTAWSPHAVPLADPPCTHPLPVEAAASTIPADARPTAAAANREPPPPPTAETDRAAIDAFLGWWQLEYPGHNHGALNVPTFSTAGAVVAELLAHRTVAELQTLALALWNDREDPWIFATDRSVFVLRHRADYLDRQQRERAAATRPPGPNWTEDFCCHRPCCETGEIHREKRAAEKAAAEKGGSE